MDNKKMNFFKYTDNFAKYKDVESLLKLDCLDKEKSLITIAIPTFKRMDLLKKAIDSALTQQNYYEDYEVIIVDNEDIFDSETDTEKLVKSYKSDKLRYFKNKKNIGMFGNWNRCFELARGEYVALLHDDDVLEKNYLSSVFEVLKEKKDLKLLSISHKLIGENGQDNYRMYAFSKETIKLNNYDYYLWHPISNVATFYKRQAVLDLGGFSEDLFPISDYVFNYKLHQKYGSYKMLNSLGYCRDEGNESSNPETIKKTLELSYLFKKNIINHKFASWYNEKTYSVGISYFLNEKSNLKRVLLVILTRLLILFRYKTILVMKK